MTPIESIYDVRLVTLIGVVVNSIETLALEMSVNPEQLLAEYLYLANKKLHETGEEEYMNKLQKFYPILDEAIS